MSPYPHERQIEYWVSRGVEDYFDNLGYDVVVLPNTQIAEKVIPYDHLFAGDGIKVFGFQYKRLHPGPPSDYWKIDVPQFQKILTFPWIYYALPEISTIHQKRNALHLIVIPRSDAMKKFIVGTSKVKRIPVSALGSGLSYYRWSGFAKKLFGCKLGWRPKSKTELRNTFRQARELVDYLVDIYIVPLNINDSKLMIRMTNSLSIGPNEEHDYDFGIDLR